MGPSFRAAHILKTDGLNCFGMKGGDDLSRGNWRGRGLWGARQRHGTRNRCHSWSERRAAAGVTEAAVSGAVEAGPNGGGGAATSAITRAYVKLCRGGRFSEPRVSERGHGVRASNLRIPIEMCDVPVSKQDARPSRPVLGCLRLAAQSAPCGRLRLNARRAPGRAHGACRGWAVGTRRANPAARRARMGGCRHGARSTECRGRTVAARH